MHDVLFKHWQQLGGSPGLVVMGGDSRSKGRGFESQCHILDGHGIFSQWFVVKKLYCLFEKTENKRKRGRDWPIFLKKIICNSVRFIADVKATIQRRRAYLKISKHKFSLNYVLYWQCTTSSNRRHCFGSVFIPSRKKHFLKYNAMTKCTL